MILAYITLLRKNLGPFKVYQIDIAAVVRTKSPDDVLTLKQAKQAHVSTLQ